MSVRFNFVVDISNSERNYNLLGCLRASVCACFRTSLDFMYVRMRRNEFTLYARLLQWLQTMLFSV